MIFEEFTNKTIENTITKLESSVKGLTEVQAEERHKLHGFNEVASNELNVLRILFQQFKSPFFYLLLIAGAVSLVIGEKIDSFVILCFVALNVILGFFQEYRAEKAVSLLKNFIPEKVKVLRNGEKKTIEKRYLVPGDVIIFKSGDIIPADLRLFKIENVLLDESALSGESEPSSKVITPLAKISKEIFGAKNIAFAGTSVVSGEGEGIVVSIGSNTFIGDITKLVSGINRESAYEKDLLKFSRILLKIVAATILIVFILNLIIKGGDNIYNFALFCVALVVTILPEALPAIVIFALSQGAIRMVKKHVVAKRLSAVEDLGNIEILCTDKTGTLTENKLALREIFAKDKDRCLLYGLAASGFVKKEDETSLNPFDYSLLQEASKKQLEYLAKFSFIAENSFDHFKMRGDMLIEDPKKNRFLIMRGAPEVVLGYCTKIEGGLKKEAILREFRKEGKKGRRVLSLAYKKVSAGKDQILENDEKNLTFVGYFSFEDPLKKTANETIKLAKELGVKVKIITGDCKETAGEMACQVGLISDSKKVILGEELDLLPKRKFEQACVDYSVFARISPKTKFQIIKSLQKKFEVGFLGEGVNDAPALKLANVGIAVKEAVDISREASDIVLLDKDLRVVINGIEEGRNIFANINKYMKCAIAGNFGNFYSIAAISLFVNFIPMRPVQILLVNLLSDFPLIAVATDSVDASELRKPKAYKLQKFVGLIIALAAINALADLIIFALFRNSGESMIQTVWFTEGILTEITLAFVIRTRYAFFRAKAPSWPLITLSIMSTAATVILIFNKSLVNLFHLAVPTVTVFLAIIFLVVGYFIASELVKLTFFKLKAKTLAAD
jgi:P-type Mg2+ transporter